MRPISCVAFLASMTSTENASVRPDSAVDNDVLIKLSCYRLAESLVEGRVIGVLGAARFVLARGISRTEFAGDRKAAEDAAREMLAASAVLEPTDEELALAATTELVAQRLGLSLDAGESQLAAMVTARGIPLLETGDKRAIRAFERLLDELPELSDLHGRLRCLEQTALRIAAVIGAETVASAVCAEAGVDKTLSICCRCFSPPPHDAKVDRDVFASYISALRSQAPRVLEQ